MASLFDGYGLGLLQATPQQPGYTGELLKDALAEKKKAQQEQAMADLRNKANHALIVKGIQAQANKVVPAYQAPVNEAVNNYLGKVAELSQRPELAHTYSYSPEMQKLTSDLYKDIVPYIQSSDWQLKHPLGDPNYIKRVHDPNNTEPLNAIYSQYTDPVAALNTFKKQYGEKGVVPPLESYDPVDYDALTGEALRNTKDTELTPQVISKDNKLNKYLVKYTKDKDRGELAQNIESAYKKVPARQLEIEFGNNPQFQKDGKFDLKTYAKYVADNYKPIEDQKYEDIQYPPARSGGSGSTQPMTIRVPQAADVYNQTDYHDAKMEPVKIDVPGIKLNLSVNGKPQGETELKVGNTVKLPTVHTDINTGRTYEKENVVNGSIVKEKKDIIMTSMSDVGDGNHVLHYLKYNNGEVPGKVVDDQGFIDELENSIRSLHENNHTDASAEIKELRKAIDAAKLRISQSKNSASPPKTTKQPTTQKTAQQNTTQQAQPNKNMSDEDLLAAIDKKYPNYTPQQKLQLYKQLKMK
jgi:hypothetical protein